MPSRQDSLPDRHNNNNTNNTQQQPARSVAFADSLAGPNARQRPLDNATASAHAMLGAHAGVSAMKGSGSHGSQAASASASAYDPPKAVNLKAQIAADTSRAHAADIAGRQDMHRHDKGAYMHSAGVVPRNNNLIQNNNANFGGASRDDAPGRAYYTREDSASASVGRVNMNGGGRDEPESEEDDDVSSSARCVVLRASVYVWHGIPA